MEKTEMNKAIAEFMLGKITETGTCKPYPQGIPNWAYIQYDFDTFKASGYFYHTSWDWLMPVWAKLRPMLEITYERACQLEPYELDLIDIYERNVRAAIIEAGITEAHQAIFEAITYLNSKQ